MDQLKLSKELIEKVKLVSNHGRVETSDYFSTTEQMEYTTLGYNFRMSAMTAALGTSQMDKLSYIIRMRRANANYYNTLLSNVEGIDTPRELDDCYNVYQMYTISVSEGKASRDELKRYLAQNNIGARVYFEPVHLSAFYRKRFGFKEGILPITERVSESVLSLPLYPSLAKREIEYITQLIINFFKGKE